MKGERWNIHREKCCESEYKKADAQVWNQFLSVVVVILIVEEVSGARKWKTKLSRIDVAETVEIDRGGVEVGWCAGKSARKMIKSKLK